MSTREVEKRKRTRGPRSDVVGRLFKYGKSVEEIAAMGPRTLHDVGDGDPYYVPEWTNEEVEAALRRSMLLPRKQPKKGASKR